MGNFYFPKVWGGGIPIGGGGALTPLAPVVATALCIGRCFSLFLSNKKRIKNALSKRIHNIGI